MRVDDSSATTHSRAGDGFVDEEAVTAILAGPSSQRLSADHADLALAADDMDFAGWCLSAAPLDRMVGTNTRRAAPPELEEAGIGVPHHGGHRWWLAGLAGALSTMLFSVLLVSLASRTPTFSQDITVSRSHAKPQPLLTPKPEKPQPETELTGVSGIK